MLLWLFHVSVCVEKLLVYTEFYHLMLGLKNLLIEEQLVQIMFEMLTVLFLDLPTKIWEGVKEVNSENSQKSFKIVFT